MFPNLKTDTGSRLDELEKHCFGETVHDAQLRVATEKAKIERDLFRITIEDMCVSSYTSSSNVNFIQCHKCLLRMNFNFEPVGYNDDFLIQLAKTPLSERCHHKRS